MSKRLAARTLNTKFGKFKEILFKAGNGDDVIALVHGDVEGGNGVLCRMHSACVGGHVFNSIECECSAEMAQAQRTIADEGRGLIIYLEQEGKGNGHLALMLSTQYKNAGMSQADAYAAAGFPADARDYTGAAEVLHDLQVDSIVLMTNDTKKRDELTRLGITVTQIKPL